MRKNAFDVTCKVDVTHPETINRAVARIIAAVYGGDAMTQFDPQFTNIIL
jgi:hypothetical protein